MSQCWLRPSDRIAPLRYTAKEIQILALNRLKDMSSLGEDGSVHFLIKEWYRILLGLAKEDMISRSLLTTLEEIHSLYDNVRDLYEATLKDIGKLPSAGSTTMTDESILRRLWDILQQIIFDGFLTLATKKRVSFRLIRAGTEEWTAKEEKLNGVTFYKRRREMATPSNIRTELLVYEKPHIANRATRLNAYLGTMLHEMVHAFLHIYVCGCFNCIWSTELSNGMASHGLSWGKMVCGIQTFVKKKLGLRVKINYFGAMDRDFKYHKEVLKQLSGSACATESGLVELINQRPQMNFEAWGGRKKLTSMIALAPPPEVFALHFSMWMKAYDHEMGYKGSDPDVLQFEFHTEARLDYKPMKSEETEKRLQDLQDDIIARWKSDLLEKAFEREYEGETESEYEEGTDEEETAEEVRKEI